MDVAHVQTGRIGCAAAVLAALASLAACATSGPGPGGPAALFRTQASGVSEAVAPGLSSAWYVQRLPIQFAQVGVAGWRSAGGGLGAWLSRLIGHRGGHATPPTAVAALGLKLPAPSLVQVTNLATYKTITVRIEDKARMAGRIILLPPEAAQALGAEPGRPLSVRLRYLAPTLAYNQPPTLRYALLGPDSVGPGAAAPAAFALQTVETPAVAAVAPITAVPQRLAELSPPPTLELRPALATETPAPLPLRLRGEFAPATRAFRIEAAAFADFANARRAVNRLAPAGQAAIVPVRRGAQTFYRVLLVGPRDGAAAERLRLRVTQAGFDDARLIQPL
ncbi:MAG: hypothetical protein E7812_07515 [Phenylobacterium sp.]|nr:MAG: hypothetical protein E7812_07515 [Phenylobacterium sp.]